MLIEGISPTEHLRISPVLVGRDDLVALVDRRWAAVEAGDGHVLLLSGEAGIGKSRLLAEAEARIPGEARRYSASAYRRGREIVGGVLLELAKSFERHGSEDAAEALRAVIFAGAEGGDSARRRRIQVTDLADILLEHLAAVSPTLVTIEDLHWADELSLDVLERLAGSLSSTCTLVVATYRREEVLPHTALREWRDRLVGQRHAEEAHLARLDRTRTARLAEAITGSVLPSDFVDELYRRSDGIPLHIEELIAAGTLDGVPESITEAVLAGRDALSPHARSIVDGAAVIGRSFDIDVLAGTVGESVDDLDDGLAELLDRQLIVASGDGTNFDFRHALIRDTVYSAIPPARRRRLHEAAGVAAIVAQYCYADVSDHYERANLPDIAYGHALFAAADAARVSAHREAAVLYERARRTTPSGTPRAERAGVLAQLAAELAAVDDNAGAEVNLVASIDLYREDGDEVAASALVPRLMASRHLLGEGLDARVTLATDALARLDRAATEGAVVPPLVRFELLAALAAAYMLDRRLETAEEFGTQAAAIELPSDAEATDAAQVEAARVDLAATLGSVLVFSGRMEEGWRLLEDAIDDGRRTGVEAATARAYRMIGSSASVLVEYERAEHWLVEGLDYTDRTERSNDHHYLMAHLAHVHWARGAWDDAESEARRALADGRGGITTRVTALHVLGFVDVGRGDTTDAVARLDEALEIGERMGELQRFSPALWGLAELAFSQGRFADAVTLCERGFTASRDVGDAAYLFPFVLTGVRAQLAQHESPAARDWFDRTAGLVRDRGIPGTLPALDHAAALIELGEGRPLRARELLEPVIVAWSDRERFWEGTQARVDLAAALRRARRLPDAAAIVAEARALAEAAGAIALERRLDADEGTRGTVSPTAPLSQREFEVARLISSGATNKEIAAALTIAPKTVAAHVEHILAKLDAGRRAEIATWVAEHRPA